MSAEKFRIDSESSVPLYYQLQENLRDMIAGGMLQPEEALPSERELSQQYGVSTSTVRKATENLVQEGLLRRLPGIGTFVAQPKVVQILPTLRGFSARMRQGGHVTINRVLVHQAEQARGSPARHLGLPQGAPIMRLSRLRIVDNEPLMIETSFLSLDRFPDLLEDDFAVRSLYDALSTRYGIELVELDQTLEPVLLTEYEAELLDSKPGNPAMLLEVTALAGEGDPVEFSKAIVRGDKCKYYFRMRATQ